MRLNTKNSVFIGGNNFDSSLLSVSLCEIVWYCLAFREVNTACAFKPVLEDPGIRNQKNTNAIKEKTSFLFYLEATRLLPPAKLQVFFVLRKRQHVCYFPAKLQSLFCFGITYLFFLVLLFKNVLVGPLSFLSV